MREASKGGTDPDGEGNHQVAGDVLWSDPGREPGVRYNSERGVGVVFGPDATLRFLQVSTVLCGNKNMHAYKNKRQQPGGWLDSNPKP